MGVNFERKTKKSYVQFTVRFEENLLETIRKIAKKENISMNEVINQTVKYALNDKK